MSTGTLYPTSLDTFNNKVDDVDDILAVETNTQSSAIEALEAKVGITNSTDPNSHEYKLNNLVISDPTDTRGDIIVRGATDLDKLALGTESQILRSDGTDLEYVDTSVIKNDIDLLELEGFKIVSGYSKTSGYPKFLKDGATNTCSIDTNAGANPLVLTINGQKVTVANDITITGLTLAPSSNNTCLVNDTSYSDQVFTKTEGEFGGTWITIDTEGSSVTALNGTVQVFSSGTEYFIGYLDTTNHKIFAFRRGIGGTVREAMSNNDTITLMKANYIFIDDDATTTYTTTVYPTYSATQPTSTTGAWWFDLGNNVWKKYSGSTWETVNAIFLGYAICDSTQSVAVEMIDYEKAWNDKADYTMEYVDAGTIRVNIRELSVAGTTIIREGFGETVTFSNIDTGAEASSTLYYVYVKPTGAIELSLQCPRPKGKLKGLYKPHDYHRCIGTIYNDGSSNIKYFLKGNDTNVYMSEVGNAIGDLNTASLTTSFANYEFLSIPAFVTDVFFGMYSYTVSSTAQIVIRSRYQTTGERIFGVGTDGAAGPNVVLISKSYIQNSTISAKYVGVAGSIASNTYMFKF